MQISYHRIIGSFCCCFLCCKCRNLRRCSAKSSTALDSSAAKPLRSSAKSTRLKGDADLDGMGQNMYSIFPAPWSLMLWLYKLYICWYIQVVMKELRLPNNLSLWCWPEVGRLVQHLACSLLERPVLPFEGPAVVELRNGASKEPSLHMTMALT